MSLIIDKRISGFKVQAIIGNAIWASRGYRIYYSNDLDEDWNTLGKIPVNTFKLMLTKSRFMTSLSRSGIHQIIPFSQERVLIVCDHVFFITDVNLSFFIKSNLNIRAFQLLDHNICVVNNKIYYGEYFPNISRKSVNIYVSEDGINWGIIYSLPERRIKHIHLLQYDPFIKRIWFATGDSDNECCIGHADLDFCDIEILGRNNQDWRSLELLFERDKVYWGTDNPQGTNWLISLDRETNEIKKLSAFGGPIYNLVKFNNYYIITTATEGGLGEWDHCAEIWFAKSLENADWNKAISYKKDRWPYIFGFGRFKFNGILENKILFTCFGLKDTYNGALVLKAVD